jgi:large subunit ribosomal protein L11
MLMADGIESFKLLLKGGAATPAPPLAPAFGTRKLTGSMNEFCKSFNEQTKDKAGKMLPVVVYYKDGKMVRFQVKSEPASVAILRAAGVAKGSSSPNSVKVGTVSREDILNIARDKMADLNAFDLEAAVRIIEGTARSLGVTVV